MTKRLGALILAAAMIFASPAAAEHATSASPLAVAAAAARGGQNDVAAQLYRDAARAAPRDAAIWLGLGSALAAADRIGEALAAFDRASELAPQLPGLAQARGRTLLAAGQTVASEQAFRTATEQFPIDPGGWVGLGVALDLQKRHREAQLAYANALRADPLSRAARNDLALSQALDGHLSQASATLSLWAAAADAPVRMRGNLALIRAAASPTSASAAGVDLALVAGLRVGAPARQP